MLTYLVVVGQVVFIDFGPITTLEVADNFVYKGKTSYIISFVAFLRA